VNPTELLELEAELQRRTLRAQLGALRRGPLQPLGGVGGRILGWALPRMLGRRSPWLAYGLLILRAWRLAGRARAARPTQGAMRTPGITRIPQQPRTEAQPGLRLMR
jgi:hypothetical protein